MPEVDVLSQPILAMPGIEIVQVRPAGTGDVYTCKYVTPLLAFALFASTSAGAADAVAATVSGQTVVLTIDGTERVTNLLIVGKPK